MKPVISADFNSADPKGRLRLNLVGSMRDLETLGERVREGLEVIVRDEGLWAEGALERSQEEGIWVAVIDWDEIRDA